MTSAPSSLVKKRLDALRRDMAAQSLDAFIIYDRHNSFYFSGFECSNSVIVITPAQSWFLTDFRYLESAGKTLRGLTVKRMTQNGVAELKALLKEIRPKTIGFEGRIPFVQYQQFCEAAGKAKLVESGRLISQLRAVKAASEIEQIAANQRLNEKILGMALREVRVGIAEQEIRRRIRDAMNAVYAEEAFDSIIAAGTNSSLPHAHAGPGKVRAGEYLLFDMGVKRAHYHSDMTRTFAVGKASPRHRHIYQVVLRAQELALEMLKPGVACRDVDAVAREHIAAAGFGDYFGHGLGHGVGLEIHEAPTLNPRSSDVLQEGHVVTVEPGIYIPGFGGVRIEDLCVVTKEGYRNLTSAPKRFRILKPRA